MQEHNAVQQCQWMTLPMCTRAYWGRNGLQRHLRNGNPHKDRFLLAFSSPSPQILNILSPHSVPHSTEGFAAWANWSTCNTSFSKRGLSYSSSHALCHDVAIKVLWYCSGTKPELRSQGTTGLHRRGSAPRSPGWLSSEPRRYKHRNQRELLILFLSGFMALLQTCRLCAPSSSQQNMEKWV